MKKTLLAALVFGLFFTAHAAIAASPPLPYAPAMDQNGFHFFGYVVQIFETPARPDWRAIIAYNYYTGKTARFECREAAAVGCDQLVKGAWVVLRGELTGVSDYTCFDNVTTEAQPTVIQLWRGVDPVTGQDLGWRTLPGS